MLQLEEKERFSTLRRSRQRQQHQRQHQRQHTSNYCSTARLHSCAECLTASPRLLTCNSACGQSAITGSKATSSSISREASEKRNRAASQQHTLIQYRDECVFSCMFSSLYCVRICLCILKHCVRGVSPCDPFVARGNAQIQETKGLLFS